MLWVVSFPVGSSFVALILRAGTFGILLCVGLEEHFAIWPPADTTEALQATSPYACFSITRRGLSPTRFDCARLTSMAIVPSAGQSLTLLHLLA